MINTSHAGVIIGGTRVIYDGGNNESSITVSNSENFPYLVQSWIENSSINDLNKTFFFITPPLFRLDAGEENILRIIIAEDKLPEDKESLFWLNIKSIPSIDKKYENENTLQIAINSRIKLIYRPENIKGIPEDRTDELIWERIGNKIKLINNTPFYMHFHNININNIEVNDINYIAPMSSIMIPAPTKNDSDTVNWNIINDYGGVGKQHTKKL